MVAHGDGTGTDGLRGTQRRLTDGEREKLFFLNNNLTYFLLGRRFGALGSVCTGRGVIQL